MLEINYLIPIQKRFLNYKYQTFHFKLAPPEKSLSSERSLSDCLRYYQSRVPLMHAIIKKTLSTVIEVYLFAYDPDLKKSILLNKYLP